MLCESGTYLGAPAKLYLVIPIIIKDHRLQFRRNHPVISVLIGHL